MKNELGQGRNGSFPLSKTYSVVSLQWSWWDQAKSRTTGSTTTGTGGQEAWWLNNSQAWRTPVPPGGTSLYVLRSVLSTFHLKCKEEYTWAGWGECNIWLPSNYKSLLFLMIIFNLFQQISASHLLCTRACIRDLFLLCLSYWIIVRTPNSMWHFAIYNMLLTSAYFGLAPKQCCGISMAEFIMPLL